MWQVQAKSPIHYSGSFFIQTNSKGTYITYYCALILSRTVLKLEGLYQSYTKTVAHFADQIHDGRTALSIMKKASFKYGATKIHLGQSEVPV